MSVKATSWVWRLGPSVSGTNLIVLLCIADHANQKDECWPFIRRIAERCRLSERAVQKCIHSLEESGHLIRVIREGSSSVFKLPIPDTFETEGVNGGSPGGELPFTGGCPVVHRGVNGGSPQEDPKSEPKSSESNKLRPVEKTGTVIEPSKNLFGDEKGKKRSRTKREYTPLPPDFEPNDRHIALAQRLGVDLREEFGCFCDHHEAKGNTFADWNAALSLWIRKSKKMGGRAQQLPLQRPVMR